MFKKNRKRMKSLAIAAFMTVSVFTGVIAHGTTLEAAPSETQTKVSTETTLTPVSKTPAFSKKTVTLKVGKKQKLVVNNATAKQLKKAKKTWKSSKPSVATVSKTGVVRAKKAGKTTISVKIGKKTIKCKVKVKAAATNTGMNATEQKLSSLVKNYIYTFNKGVGNVEYNYTYPTNYVWKGGFNLQYASVIRWANDTKNSFILKLSDTLFGSNPARLVKRTQENASTFAGNIKVGDIIITNAGRAFFVCEVKRTGSTVDSSIRSYGNDLYSLANQGKSTFTSSDGVAILFMDAGSVASYPTAIQSSTISVNLPALSSNGSKFRYEDYYFFATSSIYAYITRWPA